MIATFRCADGHTFEWAIPDDPDNPTGQPFFTPLCPVRVTGWTPDSRCGKPSQRVENSRST